MWLLTLSLACPVDTDTAARIEGTVAGDCADGADNDADGRFDCEDEGCAGAPDCEADADTDTDADSDSDADTDTDTDTDTDADSDSDADTDTDADTDADPIARWSGDERLADVALVLSGRRTNDGAGQSLVGGGDLTGDGEPDLLVGAAWSDTTTTNGGVLYLVPGPITGDEVLGERGVTITGTETGGYLGAAAVIADVDADGAPDLVGATASATPDSYPNGNGEVWVFLGPLTGDHTPDEADYAWTAMSEDEAFGVTIAPLGDRDGDGVEEFAVGAPYNGDFVSQSGAVYVFTGGSAGGDADDADIRIYGTTSVGRAGLGVHTLADLDGDGAGELGIASFANDATYVSRYYVFKGGPGSDGTVDDADARVLGRLQHGLVGTQADGGVTSGDVDGDGYADLALSSPDVSDGMVFLVAGPDVDGDFELTLASASISGTGATGRLGSALGAPGDVDADGYADLLVGEANDSSYANAAGATHVFYGPFSGSLETADAAAHFYGNTQWAGAGTSIDTPGDITGDGLIDVVIGGPLGEGDAQYSGVVWVLAGTAP